MYRVTVVAGNGAQFTFPVIREVIQKVSRDQIEGVQVSPIVRELIEFLISRRGYLVNIGIVEMRLILANSTNADVPEVSDVQSAVRRHSEGRGSFQLGVFSVSTIT